MAKDSDSLILGQQAHQEREAAAPFLFSDEEIPKVEKDQPEWHCTAEYLFKSRPAVYRAAVDMLCEPGISIRLICRTLHISHHTLSSLQEREAPILATQKKVILSTITRGLRLCAERVEELAPTMDARNALVGVGILGEKMELLSGNATARIDLTRSAENIFDRIKQLQDELVGHVTLLEPAMGLSGENSRLKALSGNEAAVDGELLER